MWAQLMRIRLKDGADAGMEQLFEALRAAEQPDSGLLRTIVLREQHDPGSLWTLVVFESEEKARAREADPRRADGLAAARAIMADVFDGPPSFTDMTVVAEYTP